MRIKCNSKCFLEFFYNGEKLVKLFPIIIFLVGQVLELDYLTSNYGHRAY